MSFSGAFSRLFILNLYFFGRGTTNGLALLKADWYIYIFFDVFHYMRNVIEYFKSCSMAKIQSKQHEWIRSKARCEIAYNMQIWPISFYLFRKMFPSCPLSLYS